MTIHYIHHTKSQKYISQALERYISSKYELSKREETYDTGNRSPNMDKKKKPHQVEQVQRPQESLFQEDRINKILNVSTALIFNRQQIWGWICDKYIENQANDKTWLLLGKKGEQKRKVIQG